LLGAHIVRVADAPPVTVAAVQHSTLGVLLGIEPELNRFG